MKRIAARLSSTAVALLAATPWVLAHEGHSHAGLSDVSAGLMHPLLGWDHLLAMLVVGLLAGRALRAGQTRAAVLLPCAFVGSMVLGAVLAVAVPGLPGIEHAILASLIAFAGLVALAARLPLGFSAAMIAVFAVPHGYAHIAEASGSLLGYGTGCVLSTIALHAVGIAVGWAVFAPRADKPKIQRQQF